ncbi:hypothetical protein HanXRQr2_Chr11g0514801 [Helianthus annuus]|uniref:Uncharacterized protein n=1 Tax=Helianthus annuus TaxID=4232 RepID=A0A251TDF9_HELAN|nr:hypothetical protein HanXRQr2_Chr11g0514801 [Helianthus annuus]KAJ0877090.1 hypothetical protein HanPSC8_Chr11g0496131 [Helianthus annuus]
MIYIQDDVHEEQRCLQVKEAFYPPPFAFIQDLNLNLHFFSLHLVSFPSLVLVESSGLCTRRQEKNKSWESMSPILEGLIRISRPRARYRMQSLHSSKPYFRNKSFVL